MKIERFSGAHRFLSNFYPCQVEMDGHVYPSTEHAFQAAKTLNERDREDIRKAPTCGDAKRMGRFVKLREDWGDIRISVMENLLRKKFANSDLRAKLLATGDAELIEGNTWGDVFWGVCKGKGDNHLGKLLMKIRDERTTDEGDNA